MKIRSRIGVITGVLGMGTLVPVFGDMVTLQAGVTGPENLVEEAMLVQDAGNHNFGGRPNVEMGVLGNGQVRSTVMRFNVADASTGLFVGGVPQFSSINAITLTLRTTATLHNNDNLDLRISQGTEAMGDWVEGAGINVASAGDAGNVTYTERREGEGTGWLPDTNYTRGTGDGLLATVTAWPGVDTDFTASFVPASGTLTDLVLGWADGNNEGILLNDVNRSGFARWFVHSSEATTAAFRPELTIDYTAVVPEPRQMFLLGLLLLPLVRRIVLSSAESRS